MHVQAGGGGPPVGPDRRTQVALNVRVVPDVPSFAVDDGFAYAVPEGLNPSVGSIVRVPLGGRRVRGWVVGIGEPSKPGLRQILSVSGDVPAFDRALLGVLRWAAAHYVAPVSTLLAKASPPNVPRSGGTKRPSPVAAVSGSPGPIGPAGLRIIVVAGSLSDSEVEGMVVEHADAGRSAMVIAVTAVEAQSAAAALGARLGDRVVTGGSHLSAAEATRAWVAAATMPGTILVGTREVAAWPLAAPGIAVVLGEGRRGMKDKATPTVHARDLLAKRAAAQRFSLVLADLVPTAEALAKAATVVSSGRGWGLVEIVDRRGEPPGAGLFSEVAAAALRAAMASGRRVLLFTDRRVTTMRCVRCRTIRRCADCGAAPGGGAECRRCGAPAGACVECGGRRYEALGAGLGRVASEAGRIVGAANVGEAGSGKPVVAGTERDLPGLHVDLTVVVDADGPLMAPTYRAAEDGLRLIARAVAAAGRGRGRRALIQTSDPGHPAFAALRSGDPVGFVRADSARRAALGFPPGGEILVVEASGLPAGFRDQLADEVGDRATVLGPADAGESLRWLVQGRDLASARAVVRSVVGRWREGGARVRVDADPIDL